jgi:hypothetical protein
MNVIEGAHRSQAPKTEGLDLSSILDLEHDIESFVNRFA